MKKTDPYKLLRIISLILGIICMLLMLKGKVFAAEMSDQDQNYIETLIAGIDNYEDIKTELNFVYQNFPFFVHYHTEYFDIVLFTSNSNVSSRHCLIDDSGTVPAITSFWIWGFRGSTDRMYITSYDTTFTMAQAVTNPHSNNNKNEHIFEVQLVVQNYHDLTTPIKTASIGCFGIYDDDLATQTWSYQTKDFYTGELGLWTYNYNYNYFSSSDCKQNWVTSSTGNTYQNPFQLRGHDANNEYHFNGSYNYLQPANNDGFTVFTNHNTYIASGNNLNTSNVYDNIKVNIDYPPENNTDGFTVKKITRSDRDFLIADCLYAVPPAIRNGEWYLTDLQSTLAFTVVTDSGSYDFSYSFDIDDSNNDFPYNGEYFKWQDDWNNLILNWEIPIDELNLPLSEYAYTENVIMTVANNVTVNNVSIPYLGQFQYITPVYIIGSAIDDNGLVDPSDAVPPVIPENPVDNARRLSDGLRLTFNMQDDVDWDTFVSWKNSLPVNQDYVVIIGTQYNLTLEQWLAALISMDFDTIGSYKNNYQNKEEFYSDMVNYLLNNSFACEFDYMVFCYNGNDAGHTGRDGTYTYWIIETVKGRSKTISYLLDTNNQYVDKQLDVLRNNLPYFKDYLDRMDKNLFSMATNQFDQNNTIIDKLSNIDDRLDSIEKMLKDLLNKILDRLQSIDIEIPEADYSSIINAINGVKTAIVNQNSGNINSDSYNGYREWLFDIDNLDNYTSPHEYAIEVLNDVKGLFSFTNASGNETVARSLINEARLFIEFLNGSNPNNNNRYNSAIYNDYYDPHSMSGV